MMQMSNIIVLIKIIKITTHTKYIEAGYKTKKNYFIQNINHSFKL